ncbi:hypothetical protein [Lyngbya confervoides]
MINPQIAKTIEQLDYRVTVGDVATQSGLNINEAQAGLLTLASDVGAHLQVSQSGDIAYLFPRNYRNILRKKYLSLRLQDLWQKIWAVIFYLIRISFGIFLVISILLIFVTIIIIVIAQSSSDNNDRRSSRSINGGFFPNIWIMPNLSGWFSPRSRPYQSVRSAQGMNFFEAVFSVLFGDGHPNPNLESKRWQKIGKVIRKYKGSVIAEQILPYLDESTPITNEDFMIPVLSRFNGYPEVSEQGEIIYRFPELQTTALNREPVVVSNTLREQPWEFSQASSGQKMLTLGLGILNLGGALVLSILLRDGTIALQLGGLVAFVNSILWVLLAYGIGFLAIPLVRYLWIQRRNQRLEARNDRRERFAAALRSPDLELRQKLKTAREYQSEDVIIGSDNLAYTTEQDLLTQELDRLGDS